MHPQVTVDGAQHDPVAHGRQLGRTRDDRPRRAGDDARVAFDARDAAGPDVGRIELGEECLDTRTPPEWDQRVE